MKHLRYILLIAILSVFIAAPGAFASKGKVELAYVEWS